MRGLAALWVVLFHVSAGRHIETIKGWMPDLLERGLLDLGHLGVAVFFVLSGFVMALNALDRRADLPFAGRFVARRLVRLTPPYYFAIFLSLIHLAVDKLLLGSPVESPGVVSLLAHAVYAQDLLGILQINGVLWTICVEIQFYFAFALMLLLADAGRMAGPSTGWRCALVFVSGAAGLAWPLHLVHAAPWPGSFVPYWYSFCAGALVCWGWRERGIAMKFAIVYCALTAIAAQRSGDPFAIAATLGAILLFLVAVGGKMKTWLDYRWTQFLGLVSYSLYLVHNNVIGACFFVTRGVLPAGPPAELAGFALAMAAAISGAWLVYRLIELPSIGWSRKLALGGRGAVKAAG